MNTKNLFLVCCLCLSVCKDVLLASAWAVGRILVHIQYGTHEFIRHGSVPGEYEHSSSLKWGPKTHNGDFLENVSNDLD
jgi:hypothetical protein